jgi:hypothetical protein
MKHFQNYISGLIVLENKTMANISRCMLDSADKTNLSGFFSEAEWAAEQFDKDRVSYMLAQTQRQRLGARKSVVPLVAPLRQFQENK